VTDSVAGHHFQTRNGPFLNAIDAAGGAVSASEFHALGRKFGFDPRGLGGFATPNSPSIRPEGEMRVLTERGKVLAARWRELYGNGEQR
jgi:hypothetical protein